MYNYYYNATITTIFNIAENILQEKDSRLDDEHRLLFEEKAFDYPQTLRKNIIVSINILPHSNTKIVAKIFYLSTIKRLKAAKVNGRQKNSLHNKAVETSKNSGFSKKFCTKKGKF